MSICIVTGTQTVRTCLLMAQSLAPFPPGTHSPKSLWAAIMYCTPFHGFIKFTTQHRYTHFHITISRWVLFSAQNVTFRIKFTKESSGKVWHLYKMRKNCRASSRSNNTEADYSSALFFFFFFYIDLILQRLFFTAVRFAGCYTLTHKM